MKNTDPHQSNDAQPLLSIAIPTYKRKHLLFETLSSISQNSLKKNVEIIIVDNDHEGNEDLPHLIMENFSILNPIYYRNSYNLGMVENWNQCLRLAKGKFITILHDDDLIKENFIDEAIFELERKNHQVKLIAFQTSILDQRIDHGNIKSNHLNNDCISKISILDLFFMNFFHGTLAIIFEREKALEIGGFLDNWYPISDYEFWCRWASTVGPLPLKNKDIALYRIAENESMKEETRKLFSSQSLKLRQRLVFEKRVPKIFAKFISIATSIQKIQIENYWSTKSYLKKIPTKVVAKINLALINAIIKIAKKTLTRDMHHEKK